MPRLLDSGLLRGRSLLPIRGRIENYADFLRQYRRFWLFCPTPGPEQWTLRQLLVDGAHMRPGGGGNDGLYDVAIK